MASRTTALAEQPFPQRAITGKRTRISTSYHCRPGGMLLVATLFHLIGGAASAVGQPAPPGHLRCAYRVNPLGVDELQPRLSWEVRDPRRGAAQSAYQIVVADSAEALAAETPVLWNSGKVLSDQSIQVPYAGLPLQSGQLCFWKVRTWDAQGQASPYSAPAFWSMGLLHASDWTGDWIGKVTRQEPPRRPELTNAQWIWYPEGEPARHAPVGARCFRRTITVPPGAEVLNAQWALAADNRCDLIVNGQRVGAGRSFKVAVAHDVHVHLRPGENTLAVVAENTGESENPAGLLGVLQVELEGKAPLVVNTDDQWRASTKAEPGWTVPGFDDSTWRSARVLGGLGTDPWGEVQVTRPDGRALPARLLRREFPVDQGIKRATASVCGLGYYELYINGSKVGDHVLDPGLTDYSKRVLYATYDVTDCVRAGANAIGVILGNGRYFAPRLSVPVKTVTYGYPELLLQMRLEFEDGSVADIISDGSWKLADDGPIRENNDYDGETYDARLEQEGWSRAGFDDADWEAVQIVDPPGGVIVSQMAEPIRVTRTLNAVQLTQPRPGVYVYDMGQNLVGWARLRVQGPRGTIVRMRFAERLDKEGMLNVANLRSCKVTDTYILKGNGLEVYEPRFTYHGFRYVELTGYPGAPSLSTLEGRVVHSSAPRTGAFSCSNELINRLHQNVLWGVRGNLRSIPTDCPQRDERHGWLGDIANQAKAEMYDFNVAPFFAKWMNDIRDAQNAEGSIPDVAPAYWPIYSDNVTWPSAYLIIPRWYHEHYADDRLLERHYPAMCKWIDHMSGFLKDGIMPRDRYGDWCVPPESPELIHSKDPARKTAGELLGTAYFYHDLLLVAGYATILGKPEEAQRYAEQAAKVRSAFNDRFLDREACLYGNGSQTSCVLPLAFGLVPDDCRASLFDNLVDNILNKCGGHLGTGLIGGQWLLRVLSDHGRPDVAYRLATQRTYPSWGYMAEKGATTVWELWNGDSAAPSMNSGNHLMLAGDLGIWLYEYLAGIRPDPEQPGFKHFSVAPLCMSELDWVRAEIGSMHGHIRSAWWREDQRLYLDITVPPNTSARVRVPTYGLSQPTITEGGTVLLRAGAPASTGSGVQFEYRDSDGVWFLVGAGRYRFVVDDERR